MRLPTQRLMQFAALSMLGLGLLTCPVSAQAPTAGKWNATGTLLESCTCRVPCTCNFGEGPSPHSYCYSVFAYRLDTASWDGVDLSGLVIGGSDGPKGTAGFVDSRATPAQLPALEKMGAALFGEGGPARAPKEWNSVAIVHEVKGNDLRLTLGTDGGFVAKIIIGRDGVTPVIVENNTVWPIAKAIKAKATRISMDDAAAGTFAADGTNANCGTFSFTGVTTGKAVAARTGTKSHVPSCCAGR